MFRIRNASSPKARAWMKRGAQKSRQSLITSWANHCDSNASASTLDPTVCERIERDGGVTEKYRKEEK